MDRITTTIFQPPATTAGRVKCRRFRAGETGSVGQEDGGKVGTRHSRHIYIYIYVDIIRYQVIFNMHHTIYTDHTDYLRYLDYVYNYIILHM